MALQTFNYTYSKGMKKTTKPRVSSISFGDGYVNRTQRGLNPFEETFTLSFVNVPNTTAEEILTFFEAHLGYKPFKWTPIGTSTEILVVCGEWDSTTDNHITKTLSATFTRTYDPTV